MGKELKLHLVTDDELENMVDDAVSQTPKSTKVLQFDEWLEETLEAMNPKAPKGTAGDKK